MSFTEAHVGKAEQVPVSAPAEQPKKRVGLSAGRIVNGVVLLVHVAMFITALCTIGEVASVMNQIAGVRPRVAEATQLGSCPFYVRPQVTSEGGVHYSPLAPDGVCLWFISGHVILAIAAIVFFIVGLVRIVFAMDIGLGTIAELIALPFLIILAFAVAVSISIGIPITCDNISYSEYCKWVGLPSGILNCEDSSDICWYSYAKRAEAAAWVIHIFLVVYFAISIARLAIFIRRRKEEQRRRQLFDYMNTKDQPPAPV